MDRMHHKHPRFENFSVEDFLLDESFLAYCQGNQEESVFWEEWISNHPEKTREISEAKRFFTILHGTVSQAALGEDLTTLREDLLRLKEDLPNKRGVQDAQERSRQPAQAQASFPAKKRTNLPAQNETSLSRNETNLHARRRSIYRIAAAIVFLLAGGAAVFWGIREWRKDGGLPAASELVHNSGEVIRKTIVLPDSSVVILNRFSTIKISPEYGEEERVLELVDGSAYFEVRPDVSRPFIVKSGTFQTTALGTAFLVRSDAEKKNVRISLVEGKVKVEGKKSEKSKSVFLLPGEQALANRNDHQIEKNKFNPDEVEDWKNNVITFTNASLEEVVRKLEDWYQVEIHVNGPFPENKHYAARFENKSLESVMEAISYSHNFSYSIDEHQVMIDFN